MRKIILFLLTICITGIYSVFGQFSGEGFTQRPLNEFYNDYLKEREPVKKTDYGDIKGSPYLDRYFSEGMVYTKNKDCFKILLRFNIYTNSFEFKTNQEILEIKNPDEILRIELDGKKYVYFELENKKQFFELVVEGKMILICKKRVVFKEEQLGDGYKESTPASFSSKPDQFYIINEKNEYFYVKSKKSLITSFNDKKDEITKFIKKEKINQKKRTDLKKLIEYYNSI